MTPKKKYYVGRTVTDYYGNTTHILPVSKQNGEINVGLPQIVATPRNNLDLGVSINKGRDAAANFGVKALEHTTPLGWMGTAFDIYRDVENKNYLPAILNLSTFMLPSAYKKGVKKIKNPVIRDALTNPIEMTTARSQGRYPLSFKERRKYISEVRQKADDLVNKLIKNNIKDITYREKLPDSEIADRFLNRADILKAISESKYSLHGNSYGKFDKTWKSGGINYPDRKQKNHARLKLYRRSNILRNPDNVANTVTHEVDHTWLYLTRDRATLSKYDDNIGYYIVNPLSKHISTLKPLDKSPSAHKRSPDELFSYVNSIRAKIGAERYNLATPELLELILSEVYPLYLHFLSKKELHNMLYKMGVKGFKYGTSKTIK